MHYFEDIYFTRIIKTASMCFSSHVCMGSRVKQQTYITYTV
jgi:hypothetical protein